LGGGGAGPPVPERMGRTQSEDQRGTRGLSKAQEAEAKRKEALEAKQRQKEYSDRLVETGMSKLRRIDGESRLKGLALLEKLLTNIVQKPDETKYQKIKLTNAKIADVVLGMDGAKEVYSDAKDKSRNSLHETLQAVRSGSYEVRGRPVGEDEKGSQAQFGRWQGEGRIGQDEALARKVAESGGVCAEKFEALDDGGDSFTIEQARELEDALDYMMENNARASYTGALDMVIKLVEQIVLDPENPEVRCIPSDAEFDNLTLATEGSLKVF